jgi:hypothetical protein
MSADIQPRDDGWDVREAIDDLDLRLAVLSTRLDLLSATIAVLTGNAKATRDADADTPHRPD